MTSSTDPIYLCSDIIFFVSAAVAGVPVRHGQRRTEIWVKAFTMTRMRMGHVTLLLMIALALLPASVDSRDQYCKTFVPSTDGSVTYGKNWQLMLASWQSCTAMIDTVTRFSEISPLWQVLVGLFSLFGNHLNLVWQFFMLLGKCWLL